MSLSMRERLIVRMVADGYTDREIAEMLARSPHTIREHVKHVYAKLGVQRRTVLVRWALESRSRIPGLTAA
jgi:DNA-binding CsgD family transcriptional regulator